MKQKITERSQNTILFLTKFITILKYIAFSTVFILAFSSGNTEELLIKQQAKAHHAKRP